MDNHGVLFLNSHIGQKDVTDGTSHTIYVGEKLGDEQDLGWMSGTRATLRNTGTPINDRSSLGRNDGWPANRPPRRTIWRSAGSSPTTPAAATSCSATGARRSSATTIDLKVLEQLGNRADGQLLEHGPTRDY